MNRTGQPLQLPTPDRREDQEYAQDQGGGVSKGQVRQVTAGLQRRGQDRRADEWGRPLQQVGRTEWPVGPYWMQGRHR